jgi:hypothetical protein
VQSSIDAAGIHRYPGTEIGAAADQSGPDIDTLTARFTLTPA